MVNPDMVKLFEPGRGIARKSSDRIQDALSRDGLFRPEGRLALSKEGTGAPGLGPGPAQGGILQDQSRFHHSARGECNFSDW